MITACVLILPLDGAKATLRSPSLVGIVEPDVTVPDPGAPGSSIDDTFEPGESGDMIIWPDASLFDDSESLGS